MKKISILVGSLIVLASCTNQNGLGYSGSADGMAGDQYGYGQNGAYGADGGISGQGIGQNQGGYSQSALQQSIGDTVLFPVDQSYLTSEAMAILDAQASWLSNYPGSIQIEGHADEQGTREYNLALGARRASSVRDYLVSRGVPLNKINVVTYGKERPLAVCSDETCWSKNRRAQTIVK